MYRLSTHVESIVRRSSQDHDLLSTSRLCHRVTVKVLPPVTPADDICILESNFKDGSEDSKTVSHDGIIVNKLDEGIQKNIHGHYDMPLPFKDRPSLPNNKKLRHDMPKSP